MRGPWSPQTFGEGEAFGSALGLQQGLRLGGPLPTQETGDGLFLVPLGHLGSFLLDSRLLRTTLFAE